jgi:hypothetical protein
MTNPKILLGQFLKSRASHPDTPDDPYAPGGQIDPDKDFLEKDIVKNLTPDIPPPPMGPAVLPSMPPPALSRSSEAPLQPAPGTTPTRPAAPQPALPITPAAAPADPYLGPIPPPTVAAAPQPPPNLSLSHPPAPDPASSANPPGHNPDPNAVSAPPPLTLPSAGVGRVPVPDRRRHSDLVNQNAVTLPLGVPNQELSPNGDLDFSRDVQAQAAAFDKKVQDTLAAIDKQGRYALFTGFPSNTAGDLLMDPELYVKQLSRIGNMLGRTGLHAAVQIGLFAMNRRGKIWNPLTIAPVPGTELFIPAAIDALLSDPPVDIHEALAKGTYSETHGSSGVPFVDSIKGGGGGGLEAVKHTIIGAASQDSSLVDNPLTVAPGKPLVEAALETRNNYEPNRPYSDATHISLRDMVDAGIQNKSHLFLDPPTSDKESPRKLLKSPASIGKMFDAPKVSLASPHEWRLKAGIPRKDPKTDPLARSAFSNGIVPVRFRNENDFGFATYPEKNGTSPIDDDDAYVPLSFTDLRPMVGQGGYRIVYFRPFITSLSEGFNPEWNFAGYYGRTDPVATYQSTGRTVNVGFRVAAFSPEDLPAMYQKIHWLNSMVYPQYGKDMLFQAAPVIRLRVGNVIDAIGPNGRGLPGVIQNLDYDYSDSTWELKKGFKLPREVTISMTFVALHDRPIGRLPGGQFGGIGQFDADGQFISSGEVTKSQAGSGGDNTKIGGVDSFRPFGSPDFDPNRY